MKFSAAVSSIFMACSALAVPATNPVRPKAFEVTASRPDSPIHLAVLSAAEKGLFLKLPKQNAICKGENNRATLYLEGSKLFLYSDDNKPQLIFVDRSGMGKGVIGYVDAGHDFPRNSEADGWSISNGALLFDGTGLQACPNSIDGAWSVWLKGVHNPGGNEGCLGFDARVSPNEKPVSCQYS
ncbi:hypothetical protein C2857_004891 [Epichloe festucae Fl1]|uniref:Cell wall protein PhiA n=1 Tax=Epichloe festucae (strain Fl1) TaxID=877507 RepID=A0A7U3Q0T8_EPIFF|nr:hypothetical protein C2857_004891 [Epichloe festucae Fl1]